VRAYPIIVVEGVQNHVLRFLEVPEVVQPEIIPFQVLVEAFNDPDIFWRSVSRPLVVDPQRF
jgi:hypothetical protein